MLEDKFRVTHYTRVIELWCYIIGCYTASGAELVLLALNSAVMTTISSIINEVKLYILLKYDAKYFEGNREIIIYCTKYQYLILLLAE